MPPVRNPAFDLQNFYHVHEGAQQRVVHCITAELTSSTVAANRDLVVYADVVRITGRLSLPGCRVFIHTRRLIAAPGAQIDVAGAPGDDAPSQRADDGSGAGGHGASGTAGGRGRDGGTVRVMAGRVEGSLFIVCDGGPGGRGQPGGNGQIGANGPAGKDSRCSDGERGGPGGRGGNAGAGGRGGEGGSGGRIEVRVMQPLEETAITIRADGGAGGPGGAHGRPGPGGRGGEGGRNGDYFDRPNRRNVNAIAGHLRALDVEDPEESAAVWLQRPAELTAAGVRDAEALDEGPVVVTTDAVAPELQLTEALRSLWGCRFIGTRAPNGPDGPAGAGVGGLVQTGAAGKPGDVAGALAPADEVLLARQAAFSQWQMLLHHAELDYLAEEFAPCAEKLGWLDRLSSALGDAPLASMGDPFGGAAPRAVSTVEVRAFRERVLLLESQLSVGFDFYGLPRNYVPLLALQPAIDATSRLLALARNIEGSYDAYWRENARLEERLDALDHAAAEARAALGVQGAELEDVQRRADETQNVIAGLTRSMEEQELALRAADDRFRRAVEERAGCSFLELLTFVATVVTVAQGAFQNVKNILGQLGELGKGAEDLKGLVRTVQSVSREIGKLREGYEKIRGALPEDRDAAKLVVARNDFEEVLKPYLDMPEAREYRAQMRRLLDYADDRNQKVVEYTALVLRARLLRAQSEQARHELERVGALQVSLRDPALLEHTVFVGRLLGEARQRIVRAIYDEHRAYEFWSLSRLQLPFFGDERVDRLESAHLTVIDLARRARIDRGAPKQVFEGLKVVLRPDDFPEGVWELFQKTGRLAFHITPEHPDFAGLNTDTTLTSVQPMFPRARTDNGQLKFDVVHMGVSNFLSRAGNTVEFVHKPRTRFFWYDSEAKRFKTPIQNNFAGDEDFAYLSPFAAWAILIDGSLNPGLRLGRVEQVELTLSLQFLK